ncbi:MAG: ATP-dependent helicase [Mycobacteriaceae bacterium]
MIQARGTAQGHLISPDALAEALGQFSPTQEQSAVIAAPLGPLLVVAGAGAGKTETMASRVVWLVANGFSEPGEVLGLTFTRKAAQQLNLRVRSRLSRLAGSEVLRSIDSSGRLRQLLQVQEPAISTYHAYAGKLLTEHGMLLPVEPSSVLLSETELWQVAFRVVSSWEGGLDIERSPASVTQLVLSLAAELAEHLVDYEDVYTSHTELNRLIHTLPAGPKQRGGPSQSLLKILAVQEERLLLLPLVKKLNDTLRAEGALDFSSQMSLAARLAYAHPQVGMAERAKHRVVLLDEYQDTGHSQRVMLSSLFGGGVDPTLALTAVGDPIQSIYGWRGASAANLPRFVTDFPAGPGKPAPTLELLTSWRNPPEALDLANGISSVLRERGTKQGLTVSVLKAKPEAHPGQVRMALLNNIENERHWVADHLKKVFDEASENNCAPPTAAVLVRRNADALDMAEVVRAKGLEVEVVGMGGLLHTPEVADVIAMLRLVADPLAGSSVMRILTGARWNLGAADIAALWQRAQELSGRKKVGTSASVRDVNELEQALIFSVPGEQVDEAGIADALADPGRADQYSESGFRRIELLARELSGLRSRIGQPLSELVFDVERVTGVAVEAAARVDSSGWGQTGREHLDAFAEVVASYASRRSATLSGLLAYLSTAESIENALTPGEIEVSHDRIQILTVHSAKGLEWEFVAVPHLSKGIFPSGVAASSWLGDCAQLPPMLRGDRAEEGGEGVPTLSLSEVANRKDLEDVIEQHKQQLSTRRLEEERRLLYVALTRTEKTLLISGYHWGQGTSPRGASPFLSELHDLVEASSVHDGSVVIEVWEPAPAEDATNPLTETSKVARWPSDSLGSRRKWVQAGAELVRARLAELSSGQRSADSEQGETRTHEDPEGWGRDVDLLLEEGRINSFLNSEVKIPQQLSVSQLVELSADPAGLAQRLRRPVPYKPNPLARRGTAFHAWIERRFGATRLLDLDELPGAADVGAGPDEDLEQLKEAFLRSTWAQRSPLEVEVPFETCIGSTVLRGRIDAVFADSDGGWTVVDWKTGAEPSESEVESVTMQLAAYRIAWAELMARSSGKMSMSSDSLEKVRAAFHYVRSGRTIAPNDLPDHEQLQNLIESAGDLDNK